MYGLLGIIIQYSVERFKTARYYRKPPWYDAKLNTITIKILFYAPVLMLAVGFWQLNNQRMFINGSPILEWAHEIAKPTHRENVFAFVSSSPMLLLIAMILTIMHSWLADLARLIGSFVCNTDPRSELEEIDNFVLDEGTHNYFNCIKGID